MKSVKNKKIKKIRIVISDVDGVLTDGGMYYSEKGEALKKFNTKDGMGVELLRNKNIKTILITKEISDITRKRAKKIKVEKLYEGIINKEEILPKICSKYDVNPNQIAYIGDDVNDFKIMKKVGLTCCPQDSVPEIKKIVNYVSEYKGGEACFRNFADLIIKKFT